MDIVPVVLDLKSDLDHDPVSTVTERKSWVPTLHSLCLCGSAAGYVTVTTTSVNMLHIFTERLQYGVKPCTLQYQDIN